MESKAKSKRGNNVLSESDNMDITQKRLKLLADDDTNQYKGFSLQHDEDRTHIPIEQAEKMRSKPFFDNYIAKRRPCILEGLSTLSATGSDIQDFLRTCTDGIVQVEHRPSKQQPFGQNRTASQQFEMTLQEFCSQLNTPSKGELLYLSTQQGDESNDGPFQTTPCKELLQNKFIPETVAHSGNLILHSVNLWMGNTKEGSSSGLHHDYHDNFYFLVQGRKRFRLFSPDCAPHMYTYGDIQCIHENGRISYEGSEARADGVPLEVIQEQFDNDESDEDDEPEVILGMGFDYKDEDEESNDDRNNGEYDEKDDFDDVMGKDDNCETRPDNFSRIELEKSDNDSHFPLFKTCRQVTMELKAGQCLYLPAGWFHEVTSYGGEGDKASTHMAVNYWYHPPDALDNYEQPYADEYWKKQVSKSG